jgi:putative ABC transport system permease protein
MRLWNCLEAVRQKYSYQAFSHLLTSFASSIGIIGIALILALSNGFDMQIAAFESDTLSGFPIMITQKTKR